MQALKTMPLLAIILMSILSFSNVFGIPIAGATVIVGVIGFFIHKVGEKQPFKGSGLDIRAVRAQLADRSIWLWMALPTIMDAVSITLSKLVLPEYLEHVLARTGQFVSLDKMVLLVVQLAFLALGEEIAWRAFFQKQLHKALPIIPTVIITAVLFSIGHFNQADAVIVLYDVLFICINSVWYSIVFHKTHNAWMSAISHFAANLFSVIVMLSM